MNVYEHHNLEAKALPIILKEGTATHSAQMFHPSNWHENVEIIFVLSGEGEISNNGIAYPLSEGDIAVVNSNCLHSIYSADSSIKYRYLIIDRTFCIENGCDTDSISFSPIVKDDRLFAVCEELYSAYTGGEGAPQRVLNIRRLLLDVLCILCSKHGTHRGRVENSDKRASYIRSAIEYIKASYQGDISLLDVARFVGINESYLSREFHKYTGETFISYLNYIRCKEAKKLLLDQSLSITAVAELTGFRDNSYFSKTFKRYVGTLPGKYREKEGKLL